ncbi:unnamed protein product [Soboliphyme baturini]|uniref:Small monomeric GTPase n=1 Tax=Soboliphyme baturini TaxID=241478 RepID=A0A183IFR1_9BILA|nr:unnamed protein product [Soboliphyme baturini]
MDSRKEIKAKQAAKGTRSMATKVSTRRAAEPVAPAIFVDLDYPGDTTNHRQSEQRSSGGSDSPSDDYRLNADYIAEHAERSSAVARPFATSTDVSTWVMTGGRYRRRQSHMGHCASVMVSGVRQAKAGTSLSRANTMPAKARAKRPAKLHIENKCNSLSPMQLSVENVTHERVRLRSFAIERKNQVINRGDSFKLRRHHSASSTRSSNRSGSSSVKSTSPVPVPMPMPMSMPVFTADDCVPLYHVLVLGASEVGKTAATSQFMTSDYRNPFSTEQDDNAHEKTVSVLLDGEESDMNFIEINCQKESYWAELEVDGYIIMYSVENRRSFDTAEKALRLLQDSQRTEEKPVILVANKIDLERKRVVSVADGKQLARDYKCKFVEISVAVGHNIDRLLVGILTQIRGKVNSAQETELCEKVASEKKSSTGDKAVSCFNLPILGRNLVSKLFGSDTAKSCENLIFTK